MSPFDLPPTTQPVSFDPPTGPGGRRSGRRTLAIATASVALVTGGALVVAQLASADDTESALAQAMGDPEFRIAYWLPASRSYVDARGHQVDTPLGGRGRTVTPLVRGGRRVALVEHASAIGELERELGAAVRLALENERLQAGVLAQLHDLRVSRMRIVETGDAERRRLERDLHDGAQQRLLALTSELRLASSAAATDGDIETASRLEHARRPRVSGRSEYGCRSSINRSTGVPSTIHFVPDTETRVEPGADPLAG